MHMRCLSYLTWAALKATAFLYMTYQAAEPATGRCLCPRIAATRLYVVSNGVKGVR